MGNDNQQEYLLEGKDIMLVKLLEPLNVPDL